MYSENYGTNHEYVLDFTLLTFHSCQQKANCTPWDIPLPKADNGWLPYCTSFFDGEEHFNSLGEFMSEMANPKVRDECSNVCLPNCEETRYSYQMDKADLNLNELCYEEDTRNVITTPLVHKSIGVS